MAIDTEVKRSSAVNFGVPWPVCLPPADGTIDPEDRAHLCNTYAFDTWPIPAVGVLGRPMRVGVGVGMGI